MRDSAGAGGVRDKRLITGTFGKLDSLQNMKERLDLFLRWSAGPSIAGIKPASLIRISRNGSGLDTAWERWGTELCGQRGMACKELRRGTGGILILLYKPQALLRRILNGAACRYLQSLSYPAASGLAACLDHLQKQFQDPGRFPHEVGIFLGYPLEDVISFTRGNRNHYSIPGGYWKVYHRPDRAQRTFRRMDIARSNLIADFFRNTRKKT